MPDTNRLAEARNGNPEKLTQRDLGMRMAAVMGIEMTPNYAQKKVSLWESGQGRPNSEEVTALAEVLKRSESEIESWFAKIPSSAEELFDQLAESKSPSLLVACYSGKPRATVDEGARRSLISALQANTSFAMVFPYALEIEDNADEDAETLLHFYKDVWFEVKALWELLYSSVQPDRREKNLKLYRPAVSGKANIFSPPIGNSRFTEVIQVPTSGQPSRTLHSWVEAEREGLYRIGTFTSRDVHDRMLRVWDAYFGAITRTWIESGNLPIELKRWQVYLGPRH
jgi:hypothetical protein